MAPVSDRVYFPPLDECLSGERVLLSWKHVATALSDFTGQRQTSAPIIDFLDDEYVHGLLSDPSTVFAPPNNATTESFETKTAPINVTSASNDQVDIKTVKEDAKWLSNNAKLNLVAALRIVVAEIQARPARHLTGPLSSQDASNLQDAAGLSSGQGSSFLTELGAATAADADDIWSEFEKPESKKRRIFETYLSERRHFMMALEYAYSVKIYRRLPTHAPVEGNLSQVYRLSLPEKAKDEVDTLLTKFLEVVAKRLDLIESGLSSLTDEASLLVEEMDQAFFTTVLTETIHAMSVILLLADKLCDEFPPAAAISSWFSTMDKFAFFSGIQSADPVIAELSLPAKTLAATVSIALLKPTRCMQYFQDRENDASTADKSYDSFLLSSDVLEQVHTTVMQVTEAGIETATPVSFAWSIILVGMGRSYANRSEKRDNLLLQSSRERFEANALARPATGRRNSAGSIYSIESSRFDPFLETTNVAKDLQVAESMARTVTEDGLVYKVIAAMGEAMRAYGGGCMTPLVSSRIRAWLIEVVQVADPLVGFEAEPLQALLRLLSVDREYWDIQSKGQLPLAQDVVACMAQSIWFQERILFEAQMRFPDDFLPYISLSRLLCSTINLDDDGADHILNQLRTSESLSMERPETVDFEDVHNGDEVVGWRLLEAVPLVSRSTTRRRRHGKDTDFVIPAGTEGYYLNGESLFSSVKHEHSVLALLGRRLELEVNGEGQYCIFGPMNPDMMAESISLLATIIRVEWLRASRDNPNQKVIHADSDILQDASKHLAIGKDIVSVVCELMDFYLHDDVGLGDDGVVNVLNSCLHFLHAVLPLQPSRIWSYLARCSLLSLESRAGKLAKITGNLDLVSTRFFFLDSCLRLFSDLIDTAMSSAVQRRVGTKAAGRQRPESSQWQGSSDQLLSQVSYAIVQASVDVFENTSTWKFESEDKRIQLMESVVPILQKTVSYSYSMGKAEKPETTNLTSTLRPAASYVVECFVQPSSGALRFQPILTSFISACTSGESTLHSCRAKTLYNQVKSILYLCTDLLQVSDMLETSSGMVESYLFKSSTLLARLCAASAHYRVPSMRLLDSLVINSGKSASEPPSLLGYLGPQTSKSFLQLLSTIGKPFNLAEDTKTTWKFFSSILRNRQQWMSNCLLTGQTPREAMKKDGKKSEVAPHSVFAIALSKLSKLSELDSAQALVILDFVASAQNYWPWTVFSLQKDTSYLDGLQAYVRELKPTAQVVRTNVTKAAIEARIAAYIGETFAMQLHHSRHLGNADALAKSLMTSLDYYLRDGVEVAGYNKSLHVNFAKNFANKYEGCSLDDFQRLLLQPRELGTSFYYDLDRANAMLSFDPGWLGRKQNGFKTEMELANANLSLVDAQIALFHAWEFLLLELSICLPTNETISKQMLQVAQQCLNANQVRPGPETIFLKVMDGRANLAQVLIQRLAKSSLPVSELNQLLETTVGSINFVDDPFHPDTIPYYRKLLKSLFVILRAYQVRSEKPDDGITSVAVTQMVLNILDTVVARGFRTLVTLIHDDQSSVCPEDLALLTAVLQACLSMPSIDQSQTQILNIMASHSCFYAATSLFSWSDRLTEQNDPVFGELSILFLLELSTLPQLAEQMACDGILSTLLTANLTKFMLKAPISPYSDAPIAQRCYGIWVKGFLPLMLNLLTSLGATVAPEIAYVLNQFPHLLSLAIDRFEAPGASRTQSRQTPHYLTLLGTSEIHSLALLTRILAALRLANGRDIPELEFDAQGLLENVEFWLSTSRLLKERLMPLGQREMEWRGMKKSGGRGDNVLEEKVVEQLEAVRDVLSEDLEIE